MLKQGGLFAPISREGALVLNNLLLTTACATVFFGTLYPLALEQVTGEKITVGAPFFNMTAGVLLMAIAFATPFGFSLAWKRGDLLGVAAAARGRLRRRLRRLRRADRLHARRAGAGADRRGAGGLRHARDAHRSRLARRGGAARRSASRLSRARGLPLSFWGGALAHFGAGVALLGLAATGFGAETIATMQAGATADGRPL